MPQASDETQKLMIDKFGDLDTSGPETFLKAAGYTLTREWLWSKPGVTLYEHMTREEFDCLLFLKHEWDYGGLAGLEI